ncbi:hypothetical protein [Halodesulfovibrio spirochaetisodalis]|uniref:Uncharacterized protein n=1 Tax=Halodesulfovibrio spirochaetisodalis TaxID=1560234 RepID=A0A1B7XMX5_9BACT|nr:hypothetical protein [Halodesulfovibrio spirochaetisodalis]OBQ56868.1 hypothetical protein SP90_02085 [Halodesulfovibrio spirochaetisodalis]
MKELSEKLLLVAAGAAVGAVGYLAWKNRDELHDLLDAALDKGKELIEKQVEEMGDMMPKASENEKGV